ncbi:MAG: hypothetical protein Q8R31_01710 [Candidatus Omnitrophota bacterium]|nr:hypothetical protein [Candidatus Omnitrophota bacterium]
MRKQKINLPVKSIIFGIIVFIALFFIMRYLAVALKNLDYFKTKDIAVNKPEEAFDFSYLLGRNIFNIDLKKESRYIAELYPVYKNIRLCRILPNRLFIGFTDRNPLAYVKLYRYFYVDSDRALFDSPQGRPAQDLPVIIGLERKIIGPKTGKQYNIKELITALNIIKETEANGLLRKYTIDRIDVANPANISCFIRLSGYSQGQVVTDFAALEVKMGQDDISDNIRILAELFSQLNDDISKIKYIDLRFKEPVIKFKDAT